MYGSCHCGECTASEVTLADRLFDFDFSDIIKEAFANIDSDQLQQAIFDLTNSQLTEAANSVFGALRFGEPNYQFLEELRNSGAAFSARKTQHQVKELTNALLNENGNLKPYGEFRKEAEKILASYNQHWLRIEYNTAVSRARVASQWRDMEEYELYDNVRWLPSRSANPREAHKPFYNRVWKRNDPFWSLNSPGTLWGCKCGIEPTSDPPTAGNKNLPKLKGSLGIDNNPGESAELFTETHPYFKGLSRKEQKAAQRLELNNSYTTEQGDGGLVYISKGHFKHELAANKAFAKRLTALDKDSITLLGAVNDKPNYDCYRSALASEWELKVPQGKNLKNAIQNELKRTKKQRFAFELSKEHTVEQLYKGLLATFITNRGRAKAVVSIDFLFPDDFMLRIDRSDLVSKESLTAAIKKQLASK